MGLRSGTRNVLRGIPTRSMGGVVIVPTFCLDMQPVTLCVTFLRLAQVVQQFMRRVTIGGPAE